MRKNISRSIYLKDKIFFFLLFSLTTSLSHAQTILDAHREAFGFGDKQGHVYKEISPTAKAKFKFITEIVFWNKFEPNDDVFNDQYIHRSITKWTSKGLYVFLDMWPGNATPNWMNTVYGIPFVKDHKNKRWFNVYDPVYKAEYVEMEKRLIDAVASLPLADRERVVAIAVNMGKTNDYQIPEWKGDIAALAKEHYLQIDAYMNTKQALLPNTRLSFSLPTWDKILKRPKDMELVSWVTENLTHPWASIGQPGKGYGLNKEKLMWPVFGDGFLWKNVNGEFLFNRNEVNKSGHTGKAFTAYRPWHFYWLSLYNLHWGTGLLNWVVNTNYFVNGGNEYMESYDLLNKYAGEKEGQRSPGALIALRDGLDAADTDRFPASVYGPAISNEDLQARAKNIIADFAEHGATLGDAKLVTTGTIAGNFKYGNVKTGVLNDIGTFVFDGPYKLHINLLNKSDLIGKWQVGPVEQPYGRFALQVPKDKQILLDLDDGLFDGNALEAEQAVKVRVVYYDEDAGGFDVKYDAMGDANKLLTTIVTTGTGSWQSYESDWIKDAKFANRSAGGSDIYIDNSNHADILHMVEVKFAGDRNNALPLIATESLVIADRGKIAAKPDTVIYGGHYIELNTDANIQGNVFVQGNGLMRDRAVIEGDISLAQTLQRHSNNSVGGKIGENLEVEVPAIVNRDFAFGTGNLILNNDQSIKLPPGMYGDGIVRARATLTLEPGEYFFRSLVIEPNANIVIDAAQGKVVVHSQDSLVIGNRSNIIGGTKASFTLYTNSNNPVILGNDLSLTGTLIAPFAEVRIASRSTTTNVAAKRIYIQANATINLR